MTEQEKIENCYQQMYQGMVEKKQDLLSAVLDDSFVLLHMTGMRQSKPAFIQSVVDGTLNYYSVKHQKMDTEICGDTAQLCGQSVVTAAVFGGGKHTWKLQLQLKLKQRMDDWRITEARASTY